MSKDEAIGSKINNNLLLSLPDPQICTTMSNEKLGFDSSLIGVEINKDSSPAQHI
jgi:hypothetical protein